MKGRALLAILMAASKALYGGHDEVVRGRTLVVCSVLPSGMALTGSQSLASDIFAHIGVKLKWQGLGRCPSGALRMSLASSTPADLLPGALGYALPYEGTHIVVFMYRVREAVEPRKSAALLAHVFAHEIAHVLQGCSRHSASGIMKARWESEDYANMAWKSLHFTPLDIEMIHAGIDRRANAPVSAAR